MVKAIWKDTVIASSDDTVLVDGNHYFPSDAVSTEHVAESSHTSRCPWKGTASYYDVVVGGETNAGAAWYYPKPKAAAAELRDRVAFWRGVTVTDD